MMNTHGFTKTELYKKRRILLTKLVEEGVHTQKHITNTINNEFSMFTFSSNRTLVSDSKNLKYNKLSKLIVQDPKTEILFFV